MSSVTTRPATAGDADDIGRVHRLSRAGYYGTEADPDDGREEMWGQLLGQAGRATWVAELDARTVGFLSTLREDDSDRQLKLTALYVLPDHIGTGIGARLYEEFDRGRRRDDEAVLEVWAGNDRAVTFYVARGWVPTSTTRPGPRGVDFVTYVLEHASSPAL